MRIRKHASRMMGISPSSSSAPWSASEMNPPPSDELGKSKEVEEGEEEKGKNDEMGHQECALVLSKKELEAMTDEEEERKGQSLVSVLTCRRNDGKGWKCKRAAAPGSNLCDHHLSQIQARHRLSRSLKSSSKAVASNGEREKRRRRRRERERRRATAVSGDDYYYYSGFGPCHWRSTRRAEGARREEMNSKDGDGESADDRMEGGDHLGFGDDDDDVGGLNSLH